MATRLPQKTFDYSGLPAEEAQIDTGRDAVEGLSVCGILTERIRGLQNDVQ